jgi:SAM-dependent methyltransferase
MNLNRKNIRTYFNDSSIMSFLVERKHLLHGEVLDIGCGRMRYKDTILSSEKVTRYLGLDLEAGKFSYSSQADLYWDGLTMPLSDASVDSAILFEVLEHCDEPIIVASEAYRVLKPGGVMLFSTPFLYQLHGYPYDFQRLTPSGLTHLMKKAGFSDAQVFPSGSWDTSLGQMLSIWLSYRPMPWTLRKILIALFVPIFKILMHYDKKSGYRNFSDNFIMPGMLGIAIK